MNEFAAQLNAIKYARRGRQPLTEKVAALLAHHADAPDGRTQPIIADAMEEDGLPISTEDLERLRTDPRKLYVHPHSTGYRVLPDPPLTMQDIQQRSLATGHHYFSPSTRRSFNSRSQKKVYQGPGGTFFVESVGDFAGSGRDYIVQKFIPENNEVTAFIHPDGIPYREARYAELQHTDNTRFQNAADAHALAAHLAEHGRLPEG